MKPKTQLQFFEETADSKQGFKDPAFVKNKTSPVHRWVPWIAGFSRDFVQGAIERFLPKSGGTVCDTFAGVGTTLVEAVLHGHRAVGFEINPYAALACQTKLVAHRIRPDTLSAKIEQFLTYFESSFSNGGTPQSTPPAGFKTRSEFYSPDVLHKVLIVQDFINGLKNRPLRDLFRMAFASTMVQYSNYSYEPSLGRRTSSGKSEIMDFPVEIAIGQKLGEMLEDIKWLRDQLKGKQVDAKVFKTSIYNHEQCVNTDSIDLIITSPPYLNNYHYNRNTRPQQYWLGLAESPADFKKLEQDNFGKFWQTVREVDCVDLEFDLPDSDLSERLALMRTIHPEKGIYGGNGWANYAASYFNDSYRYALAIKKILAPNGTAVVVIGNSILQGIHIPTDAYFGEIARSVGLELVGIDIPRATRNGNSIIKSTVRAVKASGKAQLYEAIVQVKKVSK